MFKRLNKRSIAIARAVAVIGGTGALIIGATYAASVGTATLTGNTFSASQGLMISLDGTSWSSFVSGFNFGTVPTGTTGSTVETFYLEDTSGGTTPLSVSVAGANCGTFPGLDPSDVTVNIEEESGGSPSGTVDSGTLADLCGSTPLTLSTANQPVTGSTATQYEVWLTLSPGAVTSTSSLNSADNMFDLDFTGNSTSS